ncbi:MAG TPA: helix-turn-helix domain-containing protein [Steroidobacteraceae bacterium]|nr:helix-turn-helix domain-containing protein [Steroidobacteraceae bacterium]
MSSEADSIGARAPKRARGKQRVAELLQAATAVFAERGYETATMTEIAARADAPIGSLYQFFPSKEVLADTLVQDYVALLVADLEGLAARAGAIDIKVIVAALFGLLRAHPRERAAVLPLAEARMDERTRRTTFRHMLRRHIAAILRAHAPALTAEAARDIAVVVLSLMKAANTLSDEEGLPGRAAGLRELQGLTAQYLEQQLDASAG